MNEASNILTDALYPLKDKTAREQINSYIKNKFIKLFLNKSFSLPFDSEYTSTQSYDYDYTNYFFILQGKTLNNSKLLKLDFYGNILNNYILQNLGKCKLTIFNDKIIISSIENKKIITLNKDFSSYKEFILEKNIRYICNYNNNIYGIETETKILYKIEINESIILTEICQINIDNFNYIQDLQLTENNIFLLKSNEKSILSFDLKGKYITSSFIEYFGEPEGIRYINDDLEVMFFDIMSDKAPKNIIYLTKGNIIKNDNINTILNQFKSQQISIVYVGKNSVEQDGSKSKPFNSLELAINFCKANNIYQIELTTDITLDNINIDSMNLNINLGVHKLTIDTLQSDVSNINIYNGLFVAKNVSVNNGKLIINVKSSSSITKLTSLRSILMLVNLGTITSGSLNTCLIGINTTTIDGLTKTNTFKSELI